MNAKRKMIEQAFAPVGKASGLSDAVRVRVDQDQLRKLDLIEAYARGRGNRGITRSALIRSALEAFLDPIVEELNLDRKPPELDKRSSNTPEAEPSPKAPVIVRR